MGFVRIQKKINNRTLTFRLTYPLTLLLPLSLSLSLSVTPARTPWLWTGALPAIDIDGLALGEGDEQEGDLESSGADVASIVKNLKGNGIDLDAGLSKEDFADLNAYLALVDNSLLPATLWALWCDDQSYCEFTRKFYSQMYPFPLSHIFPWTRRRAVLGRLGSMNIKHENQVS